MQRNTRQRRAILKALGEENAGPRTISEVRAAAARYLPRLSLATAYRAVAALTANGTLSVVSLPGGPPRYQAASEKHRHFFQCDDCRRVFDVDGCPAPAINQAPAGFSVRGHQVVLYGACADCAGHRPKRAARKPAPRSARTRGRPV